jgi:sRNA-binding regulator protein Hfq
MLSLLLESCKVAQLINKHGVSQQIQRLIDVFLNQLNVIHILNFISFIFVCT